jgi:rubredoxin
MSFCPRCGANLGEPPPLACVNCGMIFVKPQPASESANPAPTGQPLSSARLCPNCKIPMNRAGDLSFRVGGYSGGAGFLLGNWNQLSERLQSFSVFHCPGCGKIDLYEAGR